MHALDCYLATVQYALCTRSLCAQFRSLFAFDSHQNCVFTTSVHASSCFMFHEMGTSTKSPLNVANDDAAPTTTTSTKSITENEYNNDSRRHTFYGLCAMCELCGLFWNGYLVISY